MRNRSSQSEKITAIINGTFHEIITQPFPEISKWNLHLLNFAPGERIFANLEPKLNAKQRWNWAKNSFLNLASEIMVQKKWNSCSPKCRRQSHCSSTTFRMRQIRILILTIIYSKWHNKGIATRILDLLPSFCVCYNVLQCRIVY